MLFFPRLDYRMMCSMAFAKTYLQSDRFFSCCSGNSFFTNRKYFLYFWRILVLLYSINFYALCLTFFLYSSMKNKHIDDTCSYFLITLQLLGFPLFYKFLSILERICFCAIEALVSLYFLRSIFSVK